MKKPVRCYNWFEGESKEQIYKSVRKAEMNLLIRYKTGKMHHIYKAIINCIPWDNFTFLKPKIICITISFLQFSEL